MLHPHPRSLLLGLPPILPLRLKHPGTCSLLAHFTAAHFVALPSLLHCRAACCTATVCCCRRCLVPPPFTNTSTGR